ncbi:hypothetical protein O3M35_010081 [Rhynocoris fuscipes]|uniref:Peptidase aspartic putative domain-containing protein n=1 Tax=Rhynocoris fuscipes TaxID=488301 RepID=A0AAW1D3U2_9HEMI
MLQLENFLQHRCHMLEAVENNKSNQSTVKQTVNSSEKIQPSNPKFKPLIKNTYDSNNFQSSWTKCSLCEYFHPIYLCDIFKALAIPDREEHVRKLGLCFNCLKSSNHTSDKCKSSSCKICSKKHNTMLHYANKKYFSSTSNNVQQNQPQQQSVQHQQFVQQHQQQVVASTSNVGSKPTIVLSTAVVFVLDNRGAHHLCRVLLDSGSQSNFISEKAANILRLPRQRVTTEINGISSSLSTSYYSVQCSIKSRINSYSASLDCLILPTITIQLPTTPISISHINIPSNLPLADPEFYKPSDIDMLIGAELFFDLLSEGRLKCVDNTLIIQNSAFGWILSGKELK